MVGDIKHIQLEHGTELEALADAVRDDGTPRVLEKNGRPIAAVVTIDHLEHSALRSPSPAGISRALSVIGAWEDLDTDAIKEEIYRARHESSSHIVEF